MAIEVLDVEGMSCRHCVISIEKAVGALPGVAAVTVDLDGKTVRVDYDPADLKQERIRETIKQLGYEVTG